MNHLVKYGALSLRDIVKEEGIKGLYRGKNFNGFLLIILFSKVILYQCSVFLYFTQYISQCMKGPKTTLRRDTSGKTTLSNFIQFQQE